VTVKVCFWDRPPRSTTETSIQRKLALERDLPLGLPGVEPGRGLELEHDPAPEPKLDLLDPPVVPGRAHYGDRGVVHLGVVVGLDEGQGRWLVPLVPG